MNVWTFELEPDLAAVRAAALEFRNWASRHVSKSAVTDCELALVEACNNLVQHNAVHRPIKVSAKINSKELRLVISDQTSGFDWPAKSHLPEPTAENGRGLYLIQSLMTDVEYTRSKDCNELLLRLTLR